MRLMQDMQLIGGLGAKADTALRFLEEVIKVSAVSGHLGEVLQIAAVRCLGDMGSRSPEVVRVLTKSLEVPAVKVRRESERALANSA